MRKFIELSKKEIYSVNGGAIDMNFNQNTWIKHDCSSYDPPNATCYIAVYEKSTLENEEYWYTDTLNILGAITKNIAKYSVLPLLVGVALGSISSLVRQTRTTTISV